MYREVKSRLPVGSKPPLLFLSQGRVNHRSSQVRDVAAFLLEARKEGGVFVTPAGSNDDWYWLYAAVRAGRGGHLVSNDECRDHIFHMLSPKWFAQWKECHRITFDFTGNAPGTRRPRLKYPGKYTRRVQQCAESETWHFPMQEGEDMLCVRRDVAAATASG